MEHGPLPPHERSWRHPSELAAEEQAVVRAETSPSMSRAFALTTGTIGLFAIAVLVLAVTPGDQSQPIAVSATTAPADIGPGRGGAGSSGGATIASARGAASVPLSDGATASALATPIGEGRYALVSRAAIGDAPELDVTLPSGRVTMGEVVERSGDTVLIVLSDTEPGHEVAEQRPHDREVVTVMAEPPVTIAYADVSTLEVAEGTAVVDSDGNLVGLCTKSGHGRRVRLIAVDDQMATPGDEEATAGDEMGDESVMIESGDDGRSDENDEDVTGSEAMPRSSTEDDAGDHPSSTGETTGEPDGPARTGDGPNDATAPNTDPTG